MLTLYLSSGECRNKLHITLILTGFFFLTKLNNGSLHTPHDTVTFWTLIF